MGVPSRKPANGRVPRSGFRGWRRAPRSNRGAWPCRIEWNRIASRMCDGRGTCVQPGVSTEHGPEAGWGTRARRGNRRHATLRRPSGPWAAGIVFFAENRGEQTSGIDCAVRSTGGCPAPDPASRRGQNPSKVDTKHQRNHHGSRQLSNPRTRTCGAGLVFLYRW